MAASTIPDIINANVDILINIAHNLVAVQKLVAAGAYVVGISLAFKAIYTLKVYGEARTMMASQASLKEPVLYFMVSGFFLYLPTTMHMVMNTTFGYSSPLGYQMTGNSVFDGPAGQALTIIIQTIGFIAFIRGWVMVARSAGHGQQPGGTGKGLMHVFGGILAVNIIGTLQIINNTLYAG